MTVKELYSICTNNHWEDKELVIVTGGNIEDYQELTFSNIMTISDFYSCVDNGNESIKPDTRVTLMI